MTKGHSISNELIAQADHVNPLFLPGPLLLVGAPGVGKGTQAKRLMDELAIPQISTGDLLRQHRSNHTTLGLVADAVMRRGELVSDELVNEMVAARLAETDCENGYILDGFPRTLAQADWLDAFLIGGKTGLPLVAISVRVDHDELLRRVTGRRICPDGHIYNIHTQPPRIAGRCDLDGKELEQRSDDSEDVFDQRMRTFYTQTTPVIDHYRAAGRFAEVDGSQGVSEVSHRIMKALEGMRRHSPVASER